ncbi:hypothetical protein CERZMDRAFT_50072 [Cercospora zeae-maydis SCOH1-5]|uniref:PD-(D/E)XK nuclease-like domain-containing protein n=1 Tax=Cercospora zeae-maydis SCOH1-5 TaxID=717836 RepID=A0A6A6F6R4_9PEZI|nr:hypothetical protein CERZMDRAFT_50072 [Cercospora zeae-maydis SCOH1-5]
MEGKITHLLQQLPVAAQSITQTSYVPTRLRPSAISVETKATKGTEDKARIQLALWVATHFNKMQALINARRTLLLERGIEEDGPALRIPFHPIIVTDARVFTVMYAIEIFHDAAPPSPPLPLPPRSENVLRIGDTTNGRQSTIYIQEGPQFDAPSSLLEAYRSLAAMRCLGKWADTDFRKWFEEELMADL